MLVKRDTYCQIYMYDESSIFQTCMQVYLQPSIYSNKYFLLYTCYEKWLILQFSAFGFRFSYDICIKFTQDPASESLKILYPSLSRSCIGFSQDHVSEPLKIMCQILSRSCIRFSRDIVSKSLKIMYQILSLDPLSYIKLESKETNPLRNKLFCYIISKIIVVTLFF